MSEAERQAFFLSKKVDEAIRDHRMIEAGDRVLVGVSGGADSLALLRLLVYRLRHSPVKYELVAAHVRGDARGGAVDVRESLVRWLESEGVPLAVGDMLLPKDEPLPMKCERCSRHRRRTLFEMAEAHGCSKLALGHNLEDFAHTALMNLFSSGRLETMAFRRDYFGGRFVVIRPLAYVRDRAIARFAQACGFPILENACPLAQTSARLAARKLLTEVTRHFRSAPANVVRAALVPHPQDTETASIA